MNTKKRITQVMEMLRTDSERVAKRRIAEGMTPGDAEKWAAVQNTFKRGELEKESRKLTRERNEHKKSKIQSEKQS